MLPGLEVIGSGAAASASVANRSADERAQTKVQHNRKPNQEQCYHETDLCSTAVDNNSTKGRELSLQITAMLNHPSLAGDKVIQQVLALGCSCEVDTAGE